MDWESEENSVLLNPRLPGQPRVRLLRLLEKAESNKGHVWLATSGTSGNLKWVGLSKKALLASAQAVNRHINSGAYDIWLHALPMFHVGGLGILARSHLSRARVVMTEERWNPERFCREACAAEATLSALVPAQIHDLVMKELPAPPSMRAIIVGGGALSDALYRQAVQMGWPLLPSYGMTECSSQIATAKIGSPQPDLELLEHVDAKTDSHNRLWIKSPALFSFYVYDTADAPCLVDPKIDGWFKTEDRGEINERRLTLWGREGDFLKIGGESVDFLRLEKILEDLRVRLRVEQDMALAPIPDARLGHVVYLAVEEMEDQVSQVLSAFEAEVFPFERIRQVCLLPQIPRSSLKKVLRKELVEMIMVNHRTCRGGQHS